MTHPTYKYEITDDTFSMTITAMSTIDAIHQFIIYNYGGVIYNKDMNIRIVE